MYDVLILGGGLYGASTAYHLLLREPTLRVCIVEPDPGYTHAASARSNGGVRILFSQPESIFMSQYGHQFYAHFPDAMSIDGKAASLDLFRRGYMLMGTTAQRVEDMQLNLEVQRKLGCNVEVYDGPALKRKFPGLNTEDVLMAVRAPDDMWIDPYSAVTGLMRKVRSMGAELKQGRVVGIDNDARRITGVRLEDGAVVSGEWVLNTTGAWAPELCRMCGFDVPVKPLPIIVFYFEVQGGTDPFGVTIDVDTISFRPEGKGFISINRRLEQLGTFCWEADEALFNEYNWPRLAHRVPAFEALKVKSTYCCHYALNHFDGNLLLGAWPGAATNLLIATGASGHGLQHAPAAGRGLAELILDGRYTTLDLSRFGCQRVVDDKHDPERGFVA